MPTIEQTADRPAARSNRNEREADQSQLKHQNDALDEALMESFPASDPIAVSITCINWYVTRSGKARRAQNDDKQRR